MNFGTARLVTLLGGWSVILLAIMGWLSHYIGERLLSKWRREEQTALESLRNDLANDKILLESATRSFQSGQDLHQERCLTAVQILWETTLQLRSHFAAPVFFFTILLPQEYDAALEKTNPMFGDISNVDQNLISTGIDFTQDVEKERPYLGETLWAQFFIYRAFLGRLSYLIVQAKAKGKFSGDWRDDPAVRQLLPAVLGVKSINDILDGPRSPLLVQTAVESIQSLMLKEMGLISSGRRSSSESFENATELRNTISKLATLTSQRQR